MTIARRWRDRAALPLALLALSAVLIVALALGKFDIRLTDVVRALAGGGTTDTDVTRTVVWNIRVPRVLAGVLVGAGLGAAGAAYQAMFRNPLVSPDILGVSAGAGFGALLAIFFGWPVVAVQGAAFAGGLVAVGVVTLVAGRVRRHDPVLVLVLAGVAVGTLLAAATSLLKILADPYTQLPAMTYWLLGSLSATTQADVRAAAPVIAVGLLPLWLLRWRMNLLSLADEEAIALGVNVKRLRTALVAAATLITAAAVSISGTIGWVGFGGTARGAAAGRARLPAAAADGARARGRVPGGGRHGGPHGGGHRDSVGRADGRDRRAVLPLAAGALAEGLVNVLDVVDVAFGYPHHPVGRGVHLHLEAGEVVALLGPNGSGKTTLLRTMLGALPPLSGDVRVDGTSIAAWPRRRLARTLAYVPQAHAGFFPFTTLDVVLMGRTAHLPAFGVPSRRDCQVALEALDQLGAAGLAPRVFTELSGGERQLVLVARALAQEPRVLLMDEPAASLDFGNQLRLLDEVSALRRRGIAILMSTHHPDHARRIADRIVLLKGGSTIAEGAPASVLVPETLADLYDIDVGRLWRHGRRLQRQGARPPDEHRRDRLRAALPGSHGQGGPA